MIVRVAPCRFLLLVAAAVTAGGGGGGGFGGGTCVAQQAAATRANHHRIGAFATLPPLARHARTSTALNWFWQRKNKNDNANAAAAEQVPEEFLNPLAWNPQSPNFVVIDWERFESTNPKPPKVYYPPQVGTFGNSSTWSFNWWSARTPFLNWGPIPFNLAHQLHMRIGNHANKRGGAKRKMGYVSEDDMFIDYLRPAVTSPACPDVLKGVFVTRDNIVPENVVAFSNWAWKSCAVNAGKREKLKNKNGDGVIGVGSIGYNWSNDGSVFGFGFGYGGGGNIVGHVQMSPSGKWIALVFGRDFTETDSLSYNYIYVVQEGDDFEVAPGDEDGADQHKVTLKPGDLIRISWNGDDPYSNDNSEISWMYIPRRLAMWDDKTNSLVKIQPNLDDYRRRCTSSDIYKGTRPGFFGLWAGRMTPKERGEFMRKEMGNRQYYTQALRPPAPQDVDDL